MHNYQKFIETMKLVAAPADVQLSVIPTQACRPDEIAFCVEEILPLLPTLEAQQIISGTVAENVKEIDRMFLSFERQDWTEDALLHSPKWENVRTMAANVLKLTGEKAEPPHLFWIRDIF